MGRSPAATPVAGPRAELLERLRRDVKDEAAWEEFVAQYGPPLRAWCRRRRLQPSDAEDVTQLVLIRVAARFHTFVHDPGRDFHAWLRTLARHVRCDFLAAQRRAGAGTGDANVLAWLHSIPARDDPTESVRAAFDLDALAEASDRVRTRVRPATWAAFRLTALEGRSGAEAASILRMPVGGVYVAKCNVLKRLRAEVNRRAVPGH